MQQHRHQGIASLLFHGQQWVADLSLLTITLSLKPEKEIELFDRNILDELTRKY